MRYGSLLARLLLTTAFIAAACGSLSARGVKRLIVLKIDGLPHYYLDKWVKTRDPQTGRSILPWFEEIFYKNGTRLENFYARGLSVSAPAWGQLDTGQRMFVKGNIEYDRYTMRPYDYLAIVPYYRDYVLGTKADMPGVEVMDQLRIPLLQDAFPYERRYSSNQLYQRGSSLENLGQGFLNMFPKDKRDLVDEWTLGFEFRSVTVKQSERDIIGKASKRPEIDYYDYYHAEFDHTSHHNSDDASRVGVLKELDRTLGRIWTAVQASDRFSETAVVLVSDHGFNSEAGVYSQGFNIVKLFGSSEGGGHHVVTKRRPMLDYSIKGLNPFLPLVRTASPESYYLKGQSENYSTVMLDFDGNERSSVHLRENRLNMLHILLQQLKGKGLSQEVRTAVTEAFFTLVNEKRAAWERTISELTDELDALSRSNGRHAAIVASLPTKYTVEEKARGIDKLGRRLRALADLDLETERTYRAYLATLKALVALRGESFDARKLAIESVIAPSAMGDSNTVHDIQNYVVGPSKDGLILAAGGGLDMERSFVRVNYFDLLTRQKMRNNVQPKLSAGPVDFVASRISEEALPEGLRGGDDAIFLYAAADKQAILLTRNETDGSRTHRYLAIKNLYQDRAGQLKFENAEIANGFPLKIFEDGNFTVPAAERAAWVAGWHTEAEWLRAMHKCLYSNAVIALNEQLLRHPLPDAREVADAPRDERILRRFRLRQRYLAEADMLVLANDHWNFDARGFNPGGNHGSFFRVSTNSTFMLAGGEKTGIPKALVVEDAYDSLSVVPTLFALMGRLDADNRPDAELYKLGFRKFPGRVIREVLPR